MARRTSNSPSLRPNLDVAGRYETPRHITCSGTERLEQTHAGWKRGV